jgi:hypothetical protein
MPETDFESKLDFQVGKPPPASRPSPLSPLSPLSSVSHSPALPVPPSVEERRQNALHDPPSPCYSPPGHEPYIGFGRMK